MRLLGARVAIVWPVIAWLGLALGCETREGLARREGERARGEIAALCAGDAGREEAAACVGERCEARCAGNGAGAVHHACVEACTGLGECATDADCAAGTRCVAIAPRVRRCGSGAGVGE